MGPTIQDSDCRTLRGLTLWTGWLFSALGNLQAVTA